MRSIIDDTANFESAVRRTADRFISRFGKLADVEAWLAARKPNLTRSERNFCEAVARLVSMRLGAVGLT